MPKHNRAVGVLIFPALRQHFARAVQSGQRLRDLRADAGHLSDRRNQKAHEHCVAEKIARRHVSSKDLPRSHKHDDGAHHS